MNKLLTLGAVFFGILFAQSAHAACNSNGQCSPAASSNVCPPEGPVADQPMNECYCLYVRYNPCYYTTKHCVEEQVPCKRKCCRTVPKYYEVQRCKYVPQYYTETCCKNEKEYYYVDETKTCKKWVSQQECKYVPEYYWKHTCGADTSAAPAVGGCNAATGCAR